MNKLILIFIFSASIVLAQDSMQSGSIMVNGKKTAYVSFGLETRKPGEPVVIFESGLCSGAGSYGPLPPFVAKYAAGILYDRNGLGSSEIDTTIKTDGDVIRRLHDLLQTLKVAPPYILVGHSLGGPYIRLFASYYPNEVAGMVFIDPTDFMLTQEEDEQVKTNTSSAMGYWGLTKTMFTEIANDTSLSIGERREPQRLLQANRSGYFIEYDSLPPLPNIPVTVLIAYNRHIELQEMEMSKRLDINIKPWFKVLNDFRIGHFSQMIENNPKGRVILLPQYSHGIHNQDPKLVADVIHDVYNRAVVNAK